MSSREPFAIIPERVLRCSSRAAHVYAWLARAADDDGVACPGRDRLEELLRCSPASVDRALRELAAIGAIERVTRGTRGRKARYRVVRKRVTHDARSRIKRVTHDARTREVKEKRARVERALARRGAQMGELPEKAERWAENVGVHYAGGDESILEEEASAVARAFGLEPELVPELCERARAALVLVENEGGS
jgi:DNA-binding GntR family transcriptional regulator